MEQITIIGTGLIGGSLALGLKKRGFGGHVVGCDRATVLAEAKDRGAIDVGIEDPLQACQDSDVVVLATPVGGIIDLVERLGPLLLPDTLLTDVGSTKAEIVARARAVFGEGAGRRFLPGHPMAGKEFGGIEHADPDLFAGAIWLVTPLPGQEDQLCGGGPDTLIRKFSGWISRLGARILTMDALRHDHLCAWISHLPQMVSTALAATLEAELGDDPDLHAIGGRALREMTRLAQSPYAMWRDIALTNSDNLEQALLRMEQRLAHLRESLRSRELESEFDLARKFKQP